MCHLMILEKRLNRKQTHQLESWTCFLTAKETQKCPSNLTGLLGGSREKTYKYSSKASKNDI